MIIQMVTDARCVGSHHFHFFSSKLWFQQKLFWMLNSICLSTNICEISFSFPRWSFSFSSFPQGCDTLEFIFFFVYQFFVYTPRKKATQILICIKNVPRVIFSSCSQFFYSIQSKAKNNMAEEFIPYICLCKDILIAQNLSPFLDGREIFLFIHFWIIHPAPGGKPKCFHLRFKNNRFQPRQENITS